MQKLLYIVDDNNASLVVAATALEDDYRIMTMLSAGKMFSLLDKRRPELILLDVEMPEMDGFEALAKLKESPDWCAIPVVLLTGLIDENLKSRALEAGAADVISKPFDVPALLECVQKLIGI